MHNGNSDGRDTALLTHRPLFIPALLAPSSRISWWASVHPCFSDHTWAEMKEGTLLYLLLLWSHHRLTLSQSLQLPPGSSVPKTQVAENYKSVSLPGNPHHPKNPLQYSRCFLRTFTCTRVTWRLSIHDNSAWVAQAVEHSPVLWILHVMVLHQPLQVDWASFLCLFL